MGVRRRIASWLDLDGPLRARIVELEADLAASRSQQAELTTRLDKLEKRLGMAMGALQAATAQIMGVKGSAEEAGVEARKAMQVATSALTTAEAAADAVAGL
jgi:chromosome segregation ATPase